MAKELHSFDGNEVIATELPQYLNQNFTAIPSNMGVWEKNEVVEVGDIRLLSGRENAGYVLECVASGTTGETQPLIVEESTEMLANYSDNGVVGRMRIIFNPAEKDIDEVFATGVIYSRLTYPELWEYVQLRAGLLIDEETWQAKFAETNGKFVPYYSSGDGSTTFRTPILGGYLKGAETSGEIGEYLQAGLPNIEGSLRTTQYDDADVLGNNGAFYKSYHGGNFLQQGANYPDVVNTLDASRCSSIYGNSDTVTPETMTGIWVVKAIGVIVDSSGTTDVAQLLTATEQIQERVNEVENFASTVGIPVGFMYLSMEKTVPYGRLPALGSTYSRSLYADLWAYANERDLVKTESEWQAIASANGGNCAYYSSGDGSTTFRVPSIKCWVKGAENANEVGSYLQAGLPNIEGSLGAATYQKEYSSGALQGTYTGASVLQGGGGLKNLDVTLDASRSNPIYGNADTVQPPSIVGMWLIVAFGTVSNVGNADVANVMQAVEQVQTGLGKVDGIADYIVESYRNGTEWYEVYKSGKVRQGGVITNTFEPAKTISLLKSMGNSNYDVRCSPVDKETDTPYWFHGTAINRTTTSFEFRSGVTSSYTIHWSIEGQGA